MDNSRPFALANFQFKTITKILANRLETLAPKIVSEHQRSFIRDRHTYECNGINSEEVTCWTRKHWLERDL